MKWVVSYEYKGLCLSLVCSSCYYMVYQDHISCTSGHDCGKHKLSVFYIARALKCHCSEYFSAFVPVVIQHQWRNTYSLFGTTSWWLLILFFPTPFFSLMSLCFLLCSLWNGWHLQVRISIAWSDIFKVESFEPAWVCSVSYCSVFRGTLDMLGKTPF